MSSLQKLKNCAFLRSRNHYLLNAKSGFYSLLQKSKTVKKFISKDDINKIK